MKATPDSHDDLFFDSLQFLDPKTRKLVLDDLRCTLHNEGYGLEGNTAETDIEWFARHLYNGEVIPGDHGPWDQLNESRKKVYYAWAKFTLVSLPGLMSRIAHRCIRQSQAINTILKSDRRFHDTFK